MPANPIVIGKRYEGVGTREGLIGICTDISTTQFGHHYGEIKVEEGSDLDYKIGEKHHCRVLDLKLIEEEI